MSARSGDVIIAGAGIGGLAAALFLARRGIASTILERRTALDEAGAGIQLSPNASRLLIDLGLGPAFARQAMRPEKVTIRSAGSGRTIGSVALGDGIEARHGAPYWVIHRADLHTILLDAVRGSPLVQLLVGRAVVGAMEVGERVEVAIERSSGARESLPAALLIGADGIRSACRKALSDRREPEFRKAQAWRATIPLADAPDVAGGNDTGLWLGSGLHVVHYPLGGQRLNVVAVLAADEPVEDYGAVGASDIIRQRTARLAQPLRDLMAAAPSWHVWSLNDLPVGRMASRRMALIGDAAHPVLPYLAQGGALAIEDAAVLAQHLAATPDNVRGALAQYEAARLPRVRRVQEEARRNGRIYHLPAPLSIARNAVIARRGPSGMRDAYDWLYGWRPDGPAVMPDRA